MSFIYHTNANHILMHHNGIKINPKRTQITSFIPQRIVSQNHNLRSQLQLLQQHNLFNHQQINKNDNVFSNETKSLSVTAYLDKQNEFQRQCDLCLIDRGLFRIKDKLTGYCYKFVITSSNPIIQTIKPYSIAQSQPSTLTLIFQNQYVSDLKRFLDAIYQIHKVENYVQTCLTLKFRFFNNNEKIKLINLIQSQRSKLQNSIYLQNSRSLKPCLSGLENSNLASEKQTIRTSTENPQCIHNQFKLNSQYQPLHTNTSYEQSQLLRVNEQNVILRSTVQNLSEEVSQINRKNNALETQMIYQQQKMKKQINKLSASNHILQQEIHQLRNTSKQYQQTLEQKDSQITQLQVELGKCEPSPISPITSTISPVRTFSLQQQRLKIAEEYEILIKRENEKQISELKQRISHLQNQNKLKHDIIQGLEDQLSKTIHACNVVRMNTHKQEIQKIKQSYEQQISKLKQSYENQSSNGQQVRTRTRTKSFMSQMPSQITKSFDENDKSKLKSYISTLQQQKQELLLKLQKCKTEQRIKDAQKQIEIFLDQSSQMRQQHQITYTKYQHGYNEEGDQKQIIQKFSHKLDDDNSIIQKATFQTVNQQFKIIETQTIERIITDISTGQQQTESIEKVVQQCYDGYDKKQITTYEIDDGSEKFIQKTTTKTIDGKKVQQIDTNILVRQQYGELIYDIETQQTIFGKDKLNLENKISQEESRSSVVEIDNNMIQSEQGDKVLFFVDDLNVISQNNNIVIQGADINIDVPNVQAQKIIINTHNIEKVDEPSV